MECGLYWSVAFALLFEYPYFFSADKNSAANSAIGGGGLGSSCLIFSCIAPRNIKHLKISDKIAEEMTIRNI